MFNKSSFKNLKKKLISLCVAVGLLTSAFTGFVLANTNNQVYAYQSQSTSTYFSDPNFSQGGLSPTYWSLIEGEGNYNSKRMVAGIFDSENTNDSYLEKYKVFENPGVPTNEDLSSNDKLYNSLVLSAPYPSGGNFGYKPSSSKLTLKKDSFYIINVTLKTSYIEDTTSTHLYEENNSYASSIDSRASLYITGFSDETTENIAKFEMIESSFGKDVRNGWGTYSFYIATNQLKNEEDLDLEVWLGSKSQTSTGNVFFNNVTVEELDQNTFAQSTQTLGTSSVLVDLRDTVDYSPITNANFEQEDLFSGWEIVAQEAEVSDISEVTASTFKGSALYSKYNLTASDVSGTNMRSQDGKILFMANSEASYTSIRSIDEFEFERQKFYKVSVWAWSNSSSASAKAILVNTTDDVTIDNSTLTISTSSSKSDAKNGWTEYSFYVYGDKFEDRTAKLQLSLGSEETGSEGYVFFDNISVQEINHSQYSSNNSNTNCTTFNYNKSNDEYKISNYSFDITENETTSNVYPLAPANWTYTSEEEADKSTISGVINTYSTLFDADEVSVEGGAKATNPGKLPYQAEDKYNNVLMLGSRHNSSQTYKSSSFTLNANTYYSVSLYVSAPNGSAKIKISNANGVIFEKSNITSNGWTNFTTYIQTGSSEENVTIELSLINDTTTTKYAFFDEVILLDSTATVYDSITASENSSNVYSGTFVSKVDLKNYTFENDSTLDNIANGFEIGGTASGECFVKIQNISDEYQMSSHSGNNALVVYSGDNVNGVNYYATTKRSYSLTAGSYYKISVFVKTFNVQNGGARIAITGTNLDLAFNDINTENANTNEWTEYSFYVNASSATDAKLQLGLGNSTTKSSGYALFDDITITTLTVADEAEWEEITSSLNSNVAQFTTVEEPATDEEEGNEETEESEDLFEGSFNWYIVTSLITALAIIIAIVGVMVRKINFKPHGKKIKTSYDRRKTLDVSLDKRERIAKRQEEIKLLEQQLKEIEDEIAGIKRDAETEQQEYANQHNDAKAVIEDRLKTIVKEKETALHERNEKISKDKNAFTREEEEKFATYIKKLEKQEAKENQLLAKHDKAISSFKTTKTSQLARTIARKEFIKAEIERIDAEIEAIAKEEKQIWDEYKQAKADAKQRKAEYKSELKEEKAKKKSSKKEEKSEETTDNKVESEEVKEENNSEQPKEVEEAAKEESSESVEIITPDEEKSE